MLTSITPLGERGRNSRWGITTAAYLLGSTVTGLASGAVLGGVGSLLPLERTPVELVAVALLAVLSVLAALVELRVVRAPLRPRRQVDEDWLHRYRGWVYGLSYGAQLGLGVVTIVTSPIVYVYLALALLTGSPVAGAVVGLVFGLVRALPVLGMRRVTTTVSLTRAALRVEALAQVASRMTTGVLVGVAVVAMVTVGQVLTGVGAA